MSSGPSMAEQAYASLKRDIIRCHLRPGDVIVEAWLAERYGMSKTPVREAINALRREGLVVVVPRRGTFVKPTDLGDLQDTYRLRRLLEPEAAVLASQRAGAEDLDRLGALSAATVAANASRPDLNEANRLLHVAIAEVARVSLMIPMINTLHEEIERFLNLRGELGRPPYTSVNHGRLVETIRKGSEEEIRQVVLEGIERSRKYMLDTLLSGGSGTSGAEKPV
ncbi:MULTISPECIES: GntR family transcriptional regulator [unclassified Streptomyces]|uniref:GntR family transcriptional regulator n=1 Tax=unclassified Streptomyces TaxID=2593676 RepID=UPI002DDBB098|nr:MULTISPECIES: GntR family transcriptional regulator [unclassified Streptomyces]WSA90650.1 GntR family transcriptional regulator [Streptomyces sp. NBC_01795]WSB74976.1 GntR family transcriptional regulator [Streptomyces sp. NBC_01775]WSS16743.1 GntR family transcriptional regulator [Streptomyces sp. NBC_01186]WSS45563.1 GntR family transcriptional regulator [Streptomyces sp. NBC_01187]